MVNSDNPSNDRVTLWWCYSLHEASQKPNHRRNTLPLATFFGDLHSDQRAHQQENLPPIYLPVEALSENTFRHTPISSPVMKFTYRCVAANEKLFRHALPPEVASAIVDPIHLLHAPHHRRKSPPFSVFLSGHCFCVFLSPKSPLFLCFLKLYNIFRTLEVVSVDSY